MYLSSLQQDLQSIYELDLAHNVDDYLITCAAHANCLDPENVFPNAREKLLIRQDDNTLKLSLFLDDSIMSNLPGSAAAIDLHENNLEDFCLALEGISHFTYVIWNAIHNRSMTLMEMELQAEVDKFVMLADCLIRQQQKCTGHELRTLLFESIRFDDALTREQQQRYHDANYYAAKYCWHLESRYLARGSEQALLNELRRFYRLNQPQKLQRINRPH